ncbi:cobalamin-binding protein [Psychrosphaera sp. G1-22]|uniref:Cobalamin-binding protein n=2 Tax=Psychrosphaera algicola TaxID=3023714 RepID=A0ABT5FG75_9GAMM|nr:cobalamin-binding protein [Psychrosphaera sp. G1-22]MDC2890109.1 cobalamin-binding protein [Psychrosphaera sp. G1-22]
MKNLITASILTCLISFGLTVSSSGMAASKANIKPATRIIALAPHIVESLFDIGAGDKIVATVDYADYPVEALDIPRVGGYYGIQMEKILALKPDLIIVWKGGNQDADIAQLEKLGLPVIYSEPTSLSGVTAELRMFGELTGLSHNAEVLADQFEDDLEIIQRRYGNRHPVDVFYQLWSEPMMTVNKNTWINQLIETCGGVNVFANNPTEYPQISIENVIVAQPSIIIMPQEKSDKPQPKIDWQKWTVVPAVKNNQFMEVDADLIHRFSRRMLIGLGDMCKKIDGFR